ncbi:GNAT family N-acetyltransferase [Pseudotenacibaculum sp. MALMAid0570]|uniref:GNAT family N-acetyltransferase n=1 Tax=Pseudotenacibaculum sp. MALMAid0570 TaxID=3143938 RepID=UPI0032E02BF8
MKEEYKIREMVENDVLAVVELVRSSFHGNYLIPSIYRGNGIDKFIINELNNPFSPYNYTVICKDEQVIGYTEFKLFKEDFTAFLNIVAICNEFKGKGLGRNIFDYCRSNFFQQGYQNIELDVYATNVIALKWYLNYGFIKTNLKSFLKLEVKSEKINDSEILINNYSQYISAKNTFGFYFIDVILRDTPYRLGIINNDLFIRGRFYIDLFPHINTIKTRLALKNIYFLGVEKQFDNFIEIDQIIRMKLKLK